MSKPADFILETRGLTKEFAGFFAVRDVDLRVRRGSIHALIGPNGAGKTTCFNLLTKFLKPSAGQILYKGQDITAMAPADVARLGLVRSFQSQPAFDASLALEMLCFLGDDAKEGIAAVREKREPRFPSVKRSS